MRRRKTRSMKNPCSVSQEEDLWNEYNEELLNMNESLFIDKWHDTCEILPDYDNVWFIADGKICVGMYEPEQKIFCMADGMGVELKDVRQWKYVGINKQIAKYPDEKQLIAVSIPSLPCLAVGIFTDHCIDEETGDEVSAIILDWDLGIIPYKSVSYWFALPELPMVVLDPIGDSQLAVMPEPEIVVTDEAPEEVQEVAEDVAMGVPTEEEKQLEDESPVPETDGNAPVEQPMELGNRSMESDDVKSSIAKSKMAVSGSDDLSVEDPIKKGLFTESVSNKKDDSVASWYVKEYPTDDMGGDIIADVTFEDIYDGMKNKQDFYDIIGVGDSLIRERVFNELADIYGVDYEDIYNIWIDSDDSSDVDDALEYLFKTGELTSEEYDIAKNKYRGIVESRNSKSDKLKEARIYYDFPGDYHPWSGAVDTWNILEENDAIDDLERFIDEVYPEGIGETELNDLLWFEPEYVFEALGIKNPYDEDEDEEEEEEEEEEQPIAEEEYKGYDIYTWEGDLITICKNDKYIRDAESVEDAKNIIDEGNLEG